MSHLSPFLVSEMGSLLSLRQRFLNHFHRYNSYFQFNLSTISFSEAKSKLERESNPEKLLAAFESIMDELDFSASRHANKVVIRRLVKAGRLSDVEKLLEKQKHRPKARNEVFFSTLIYGYGRAGMVDQAIQTFDQMDGLGTPRSSISFNELLNACIGSKKFDQVTKLFAEIPKKYAISPDKTSYGYLIKAVCESGGPESGYLILDEMEKNNIKITPYIYTTLLDAFYKKNKIEDATRIWDEMCKKGFNPNIVAYTIRLLHIAFHGKPEEAMKLLDEMVSMDVKPDTISYNYVITCYCRNGRIEDAKKVYEAMEGNGCAPDSGTFKHFIYYLCRDGDYDFALGVCKESIKQDKVPGFDTMELLIQGLARNSRTGEAKNLLNEVKNKFPSGMENAWRGLENKLCLNVA